MSDFSLKGVLRKHKGRTPDVDVRTDVIDPSGLFPAYNWSLRDLLDSWSSTEHSWQMRECFKEIGSKYDWQAKYEQAWTTIRVRIKLKPKNDGVEQIIDDDNLRSVWRNGIESLWNGNWSSARSGELACRFMFEVSWVSSDHHHKVKVKDGDGQTNLSTWHTSDSGSTAAHEFGHMIGQRDEYDTSDCPYRHPVNTGSVMDNNSSNVPARMLTVYAESIGQLVTDEDGSGQAPL